MNFFKYLSQSILLLALTAHVNTQCMETNTIMDGSIDTNNPKEVSRLWLECASAFMLTQGTEKIGLDMIEYFTLKTNLSFEKPKCTYNQKTPARIVRFLQAAEEIISQKKEPLHAFTLKFATDAIIACYTADIDQRACAIVHHLIVSGKVNSMPKETLAAMMLMAHARNGDQNYSEQTKNMIYEVIETIFAKCNTKQI